MIRDDLQAHCDAIREAARCMWGCLLGLAAALLLSLVALGALPWHAFVG